MFDPCKLTIGSRLKHEGNYCKVVALEEKELADGTTDVEITCKYLDNSKTVKGLQICILYLMKEVQLIKNGNE